MTVEAIAQMREKFYADERNIQAQNVVTKTDPFEACISRRKMQETHYVFSNKIELEGKPITNQKNSGRCWIFACLNIMRIPFMKRWHLEEFEFSQTYLYFWDKVSENFLFSIMLGDDSKFRIIVQQKNFSVGLHFCQIIFGDACK